VPARSRFCSSWAAIILSLIVGAWPAMKDVRSILPVCIALGAVSRPRLCSVRSGPIYGTLVTLGDRHDDRHFPVGLGIAMFLTELCPQWLRRPIGIAVELLAGIPSIIYGMWGFFVLGPVHGRHVSAVHDQTVRRRPPFSDRFSQGRRRTSACSTRR